MCGNERHLPTPPQPIIEAMLAAVELARDAACVSRAGGSQPQAPATPLPRFSYTTSRDTNGGREAARARTWPERPGALSGSRPLL
jgi:hypothetical protein